MGILVWRAHQIVSLAQQTEHLVHHFDTARHILGPSLNSLLLCQKQKIKPFVHLKQSFPLLSTVFPQIGRLPFIRIKNCANLIFCFFILKIHFPNTKRSHFGGLTKKSCSFSGSSLPKKRQFYWR